MMHGWLKLRDAFPKSAHEYTQPKEQLLQRRRADMDETWGKIAVDNERMLSFGLTPRTDDQSVIKLNVGGLGVTVFWPLLAETEGFEDSALGTFLKRSWGEGCVPHDSDGRIVLDESPACIKHIIAQTMLRATGRASSVAVRLPERLARSAVAADEVPCLIYTAHVMGLSGSMLTPHPKYVNMNGGSTVLELFEIAPLGAKIREWVGSSAEQMILIYRATRDGFDTKPFKPGRNEDISRKTVSLVRVKSGQGNDDDSIVGGYSALQCGKGVGGEVCITAETFLFMLKDGGATGEHPSKPIKWNPYPNKVGTRFITNKDGGACVGGNDLGTILDATSGGCTLCNGRDTFDIEKDSPFLALNGNEVVEIEVYRYSAPAPPTTTAPSTTKPRGDDLTCAEAHDVRLFGESIASSLMEERMVLDRVVKEMKAAGARVSAAADALETVYGPSVAAGEHDAVVELNVRGTRMTTLRSTLQACPRSALATMFDEERWTATDKDTDELGRRLIHCNPNCFSKILDVLRMRKRALWSRGAAGSKQEEKSSGVPSGAVLIKQADVEAFGEAVNMYFPGCESFIMDLVESV